MDIWDLDEAQDEPIHHLPYVRNAITAVESDTVMKSLRKGEDAPGSEALIMEVVKHQTSISLPALRRCIKRHHVSRRHSPEWDENMIAMQYIEGQTLSDCWNLFSFWTKLRVIWTLRQYISQLRRVVSPYSNRPGPIGGTEAIPPPGSIFFECAKPFETPNDLAEWYNRQQRANESDRRVSPELPYFPDASPLVLTHADLHLENILYDETGRVWLIDWGHAGFLPRWFEYVTAVNIAYTTRAPSSWRLFLPLITRPYFAHESWAEHTLIHLPPGRMEAIIGLDVVWRYLRSFFT